MGVGKTPCWSQSPFLLQLQKAFAEPGKPSCSRGRSSISPNPFLISPCGEEHLWLPLPQGSPGWRQQAGWQGHEWQEPATEATEVLSLPNVILPVVGTSCPSSSHPMLLPAYAKQPAQPAWQHPSQAGCGWSSRRCPSHVEGNSCTRCSAARAHEELPGPPFYAICLARPESAELSCSASARQALLRQQSSRSQVGLEAGMPAPR